MLKTITKTTDSLPSGLSLTTVKSHSRIELDSDDTLLTLYINSAIRLIENETNRDWFETVYDQYLPCFDNPMVLLKGAVSSVDSVKYYDGDDTLQTLSTDIYNVILPTNTRPKICRVYDQSWPTTTKRIDAVVVRYTCQQAVDFDFQVLVSMMVSNWYENREATTSQNLKTVPFGVEPILENYKTNFYW